MVKTLINLQPLAPMETSALWEQTVFLVGELKYVLNNRGQQFVMHTGAMKMLVCYVGNLDTLLTVHTVAM